VFRHGIAAFEGVKPDYIFEAKCRESTEYRGTLENATHMVDPLWWFWENVSRLRHRHGSIGLLGASRHAGQCEIASHVKNNTERAATASLNVTRVREEIEIGNRQMGEMTEAVSRINSSSSEIGKIIKTIEDIAFQINILALNAAVEAARAGAAGKGFAVVAQEVRNLASKSEEAAKITTHLIENSMKQVESGTRIADETANALNRVVESTKIVLDSVEQISHTSNRQSEAIAQVSIGVDQISGVVQTNSATLEESASASKELSQQAQTLKSLVKKFKLKKDREEIELTGPICPEQPQEASPSCNNWNQKL
jgi:Methyl-accepting chemotaxis protein